MNAPDLSTLGAGFSHEALGSQAVFRCALQALSHPGRCFNLPSNAQAPKGAHPAAAALLLAMLDSDCSVWLSPRLAAGNAALWLQFHTGCVVLNSPEKASFVWVAQGDNMPALQSLQQGTDAYPDQSATCVMEVTQLDAADTTHAWHLTGPGIQTSQQLLVQGLPADFEAQWSANHARFPRGVDLFFASGDQLAGLPRTTRLVTPGAR
jgi:alpha-D-ribose 1-methylphosphonate 5-triphosphate synthase subunit PhnH